MDNFIPHTIMLALSLAVLVPAAVAFFSAFPHLQKYGVFAAMFFIVLSQDIGLNYLADHEYVKGTTQAYEISFLDFFSLIYFIILLRKPGFKFQFRPPGTAFFIVYLLMCLVSTVNATNITYSAFEIFRMLKMGFFMAVMYNILLYYNCFSTVINGIACGMMFNLCCVLFQKYVQGYYATTGFLRHKNNAGMYANMIMPICLYIVLNVKFSSGWRRPFYAVVFFACVATVILTLSRGAWAVSAVCVFLIMSISLIRGISAEKVAVIGATAFLLLLGVVKSYDTIYERLTIGNEAGTKGRQSLIYNAADMANKNFFGVGINNYTAANTPENNYGNIYENLNYVEGRKNLGKVETIYMLTAAECGWLGLASLLLWYFYYLLLAFRCAVYYWKSNMAYLAVGLTVSLFGAYLHSTLEWILRYSTLFYLLMVMFAMISALAYFRKRGVLKRGA